MKKLLSFLLCLPLFCAAQTVVHTPGREISNVYTGPSNQFIKGVTLGPSLLVNFPVSPLAGTRITIADPLTGSDCTSGGGDGITVSPHECYYNGTSWAPIGFACGTSANPGIPIWNGTACVVDTNATSDGNGNLTTTSISAGTIVTTGVGFTEIFQSQAPPSGAFLAAMAAGQMVWFGNSSTNQWQCENKDGSSCSPGGAAFSAISSGANSNAGTYSATNNSWDFTGTTIFKLRVTNLCTTTVIGDICYDNNASNKMWHIWQNGADNFLLTALASGTFTNGDAVAISKVGNIITLVDSGGPPGGSGTASLIPFSCGASISATVTDYCGFGNLNTSEANSQSPVSRAGTVSHLQCRIGGAGLSSAQTITIMVRKGLAALGSITSVDTTLTCTLNSTNSQSCSDGADSFTVVAGDVINIRTVPLNGPAIGVVTCSAQF